MFNLIFRIMKNPIMLALFLSFFLISCEEDDHDHEGCQECHLEIMMADGTDDHSYEIGEFCGEDLHEVEENGWTVVTAFDHMGTTYEAGYQFSASEVHCEEHAH